jgi:hypothetical protein
MGELNEFDFGTGEIRSCRSNIQSLKRYVSPADLTDRRVRYQNMVEGFRKLTRDKAYSTGCIALRVAIDEENSLLSSR